jgi:hypothetical protein
VISEQKLLHQIRYMAHSKVQLELVTFFQIDARTVTPNRNKEIQHWNET